MWSAILGILVFGAMLVLLFMGMREVNSRLDNPQRRTMPRDVADRADDRST